jgi:diguanylate cyclase (GGDEF)-like protein/PAS domain S-box-containing protein
MPETDVSQHEHAGSFSNRFWFKSDQQVFLSFFENLSEGIWCFEPREPVALHLPIEEKLRLVLDSVCIGANRVAVEMWGTNRVMASGLRFADVVLQDGLIRNSLRSLVDGDGRLEKCKWVGYAANGQQRHFSTNMLTEIQTGFIKRIWGWQRDVSEEMQILDALQTSESRLRHISDNMLDLILEVDTQGMLIYASPSNQSLLGYRPEDLLETQFLDIVYPDDRKRVQGQLQAAMQEENHGKQTGLRIEYRARHIDGHEIDVESTGSVLQDEFGQVAGVVFTTRDISQRTRAERLQKALYRISEAANTAQDLKGLFDLVHQIVSELFPAKNLYIAMCDEANRSLYFPYYVDEFDLDIPDPEERFPYDEISGWLTMYLIRKGMPLLVSPEAFETLVEQGEVVTVGQPSLDWLGVPLKTSEGKIIGVLVVQTYTEGVRYGEREKELLVFVSTQIAMTIEHRRVQDALRQSEARQRAILNAIPDLMLIINREGSCLNVFTPNEDLLEMNGKLITDILPADSVRKYLSAIKKALNTGQVQMVEYSLPMETGERFYEARIAAYGSDTTLSVVRDITERKENEQDLAKVNDELKVWVNELEQRTHEATLLNRMGDMLQSCLNVQEAFAVVRQYATQLFPEHVGALYTLQPSHNMLDMAISWGDKPAGEMVFSPEACWGLRRGRVHVVADGSSGLHCKHVVPDEVTNEIQPYLCVPMSAHGDPLGMLYLRTANQQPIQRWENLAVSMSEQVALALANLNLREILSSQSIRDPLTNLFNRRYLQETLERELSRSQRYKLPLGVIMADIDHFKQFNDSLGHDAGDGALQELGRLLQAKIRREDIACRYGGDEFAIVLPGASLEVTQGRAEHIREAVRQMSAHQDGRIIGRFSLSFGVATFPEHGTTVKDLVQAADAALYRAKKAGRDRVDACGQSSQVLPDN